MNITKLKRLKVVRDMACREVPLRCYKTLLQLTSSWNMHELTNFVDNIGQFKTFDSTVLQGTNNLS